jgi:hypothetical protein
VEKLGFAKMKLNVMFLKSINQTPFANVACVFLGSN